MRTQFSVNQKEIEIDVFTPKREGRYPIVCALHGSGGLNNASHLDFAQILANQGFLVCVPHYFQSTNTTWADNATIWREFPTWMETISRALDTVSEHPSADPERIAIVGFSLGAYLALSLAANQQRIKAVVDFFGGIPDHFADKLEHMAPVLILHGEADTIVPVREAEKLRTLLDSRNVLYEIKLYRGAGHGFRGFDMMDAGQRTYNFLRKHLAA